MVSDPNLPAKVIQLRDGPEWSSGDPDTAGLAATSQFPKHGCHSLSSSRGPSLVYLGQPRTYATHGETRDEGALTLAYIQQRKQLGVAAFMLGWGITVETSAKARIFVIYQTVLASEIHLYIFIFTSQPPARHKYNNRFLSFILPKNKKKS